eukprot:TRINITY_DN6187_c0_g2_i1.p1 TRINITY_DN6187_c0_g2~~TRINITY_DN6187_c0_g2_i1.p1  ORF type:complete len:280 (-),score=77.87 TRINITY_DN6187_c0_g2_i1:331-1170(-)
MLSNLRLSARLAPAFASSFHTSAGKALSSRRFFVGGNWKCNGSLKANSELVGQLNGGSVPASVEVVVCPASLHLTAVKAALRPEVQVGAQNTWKESKGAFTGEISPDMLLDAGIQWTILGHSERRDILGETDELIASKIALAQKVGLNTIVAIGDQLQEYKDKKTTQVLSKQMTAVAGAVKDWSKVVIAYEPVFCIGTGFAMSAAEAQSVHVFLRQWVEKNVSAEVAKSVRILYGGSVNAANCQELATQPDIDGFLVGGASLKGKDFLTIINAGLAKSA